MNGNFHLVTKEQVVGHTIVIASMQSVKGCKIISYTIGKGYCVSYSLNSGIDECGFTNDMAEAIDLYNSVNIGCTFDGGEYTTTKEERDGAIREINKEMDAFSNRHTI